MENIYKTLSDRDRICNEIHKAITSDDPTLRILGTIGNILIQISAEIEQHTKKKGAK